MNEHLRKALQKFFGEISKFGEGSVSDAAIDCFRLLGGDVNELKLDAPAEEESDEKPANDPSDDTAGDQG